MAAIRSITLHGDPGRTLHAPSGTVPNDVDTPRFVMAFAGDGNTSGSVRQLSLDEIKFEHQHACWGEPDRLWGNLFALVGGNLVGAKLINLSERTYEADFTGGLRTDTEVAVVDHDLRSWFGSFTVTMQATED